MRSSREFDGWWRLGLVFVRPLYGLLFRMRFDGLRNLPATGPAVVASNHVSVLDPVAVALATSARGRVIRFVAAAEFFSRPLLGRGLRLTGQIPIRRGTRDLAALGDLTDVLKGGGLAGIFPEGRVSEGGGPLRGRSGAARVALATGVPVVPVGIYGTQLRWPRGQFRWRPLRPTLVISFGPPMLLTADPSGSARGLKDATASIMSAIQGRVDRAMSIAVRRGGAP